MGVNRLTQLSSPVSGAQVLTGNGQTITLPTTGIMKDVSTAAARTGTILAAGTVDGQVLVIIHSGNAANTITFDVRATSNVLNGVTCVLRGLETSIFVWVTTYAAWVPLFR